MEETILSRRGRQVLDRFQSELGFSATANSDLVLPLLPLVVARSSWSFCRLHCYCYYHHLPSGGSSRSSGSSSSNSGRERVRLCHTSPRPVLVFSLASVQRRWSGPNAIATGSPGSIPPPRDVLALASRAPFHWSIILLASWHMRPMLRGMIRREPFPYVA